MVVSSPEYFGSNDTDFCHINDFNSSTITYQSLKTTITKDVTETAFFTNAELGQPFAVSGVGGTWKASTKWNEEYFKNVFSDFELFSSTFATNASPVFGSAPQENIYYGIFLNDKSLADLLANDYTYPSFIPQELNMQGS